MKKIILMVLMLFGAANAWAAGHWVDATTADVLGRDGNPSYMTWSPVQSDATGNVTRLRVRIREFGAPTEIGLALYRSDGTKLTSGTATTTAAGYREIQVPSAAVVLGQRLYIAAQASSAELSRFSFGAATGGSEGPNSYAGGLPATLPGVSWSDGLLTAGIYIEGGPTAAFSGTPTSGANPLTVAFTDSSTGNITSRLWNFGDGSQSNEQNPSHVYEAPGIYTVSLTVGGPDGSNTATRTDYVRVAAPIPPGSLLYRIQIDPAAHAKFGLAYPATYRFRYTPGLTGLTAQYRYGPDDWRTLPAKGSADLFNGIAAARFDSSLGTAWLSVGFSRQTDDIYLRIVDSGGRPVDILFDTITRYYDDRKAAVTISLDDWDIWEDASFRSAVDYIAAQGLYFSVGLKLLEPAFASIQEKINQHGRQMEIASHSVYHSCDTSIYQLHGYDTETAGSRDLIRENLTFADHPFVPLYIEPCGFSDSELQTQLAAADYLVSRSLEDMTDFAPWDPALGRYGRAGITIEWDEEDDQATLNLATTAFTQTYGAGGIYHLMNHPWMGNNWHDGTYIAQHLQFISRRPDVWYAPVGQLYLYRFLAERRGNLTVTLLGGEAPPSPDFSATPMIGTVPLPVQFTNLTAGTVTSWSWDFGDGSRSEEQNPSHFYATAGTYTVKLTATGPGGTVTATKTAYILVNPPPPVAAFSSTPLAGTAPLSVVFTDASTGVITSWLWDFGDGATSSQQNPVHVYTAAGTYSVKLTVTGPGGSGSSTRSSYVTVSWKGPTAGFTGFPLAGTVPLQVVFSDTSVGVVTDRFWEFGDGATSTEQKPVHVYEAAGIYTVKLTVTGPGGSGSSTRKSYVKVSVSPPAAAFAATPLAGAPPLSVSFTDLSTGSVTGWLWNFGDSTSSTQQNPVHLYRRAGTYTVKLTVTGPGGLNSVTRQSYIKVQ